MKKRIHIAAAVLTVALLSAGLTGCGPQAQNASGASGSGATSAVMADTSSQADEMGVGAAEPEGENPEQTDQPGSDQQSGSVKQAEGAGSKTSSDADAAIVIEDTEDGGKAQDPEAGAAAGDVEKSETGAAAGDRKNSKKEAQRTAPDTGKESSDFVPGEDETERY